MNSIRQIHIPGLYRIEKSDREKMFSTLLSAFQNYPKLFHAFPDEKKRKSALEATLRYYGAYDLAYGAGFSLDERLREVALLVHSDHMQETFLKHLASGSYSRAYRKAMGRLSRTDRKKRVMLFHEVDRLEKDLPIPEPHLYLDFLGTANAYQHQGRGRTLMQRICAYADSIALPIMLFTNTAEDIEFYCSLGFRSIGQTASETFGFVNTYLLYDAQSRPETPPL